MELQDCAPEKSISRIARSINAQVNCSMGPALWIMAGGLEGDRGVEVEGGDYWARVVGDRGRWSYYMWVYHCCLDARSGELW